MECGLLIHEIKREPKDILFREASREYQRSLFGVQLTDSVQTISGMTPGKEVYAFSPSMC